VTTNRTKFLSSRKRSSSRQWQLKMDRYKLRHCWTKEMLAEVNDQF